jgi:CheY-like chemotaxis protein
MARQVKRDTSHTVLIVEDSPDFSNLLKFIVEDEGHQGVQFPLTEEDIVAWARDQKPAVILMDLALRRKGGLEYIQELKNDPDTLTIPIIIISGRDLNQRDLMELQAKGVKYLRKGRVEVQEIKDEIRRAIYSPPTKAT